MDEIDRRVSDDVKVKGWHVMLVPASEHDQDGFVQYGYTVGLWSTYAHPELILLGGGLQTETMFALLAMACSNVAGGQRYATDRRYGDIMRGLDMQIGRVSPENRKAFMTYADWFNERNTFGALQLVWPDIAGRFPTEAGYDEIRFPQPLLAGAPLNWVRPVEKLLHTRLGPVRRQAPPQPPAQPAPAPNDAGGQP